MLTERLEPDDYSHLIVACLLHDIGYVRGILKGDGKDWFVVDAGRQWIRQPARVEPVRRRPARPKGFSRCLELSSCPSPDEA
jgi:hypothetical protein